MSYYRIIIIDREYDFLCFDYHKVLSFMIVVFLDYTKHQQSHQNAIYFSIIIVIYSLVQKELQQSILSRNHL